tara:strand:- start:5377 stop:10329 length:4953 start_codon:yes stop_codon:yes gene_type:complete
MAKKILELKQFMKGIVSSPSSTDIPEDSAVFSANIDAISEEGKLKGVKKDLEVSDSDNRISNIQLFPTSNTGVSATPLSSVSSIVILNNDTETTTPIGATQQAYKTFEANEYISNILLSASTISTAYPIALQDFANDTEATYLLAGTTNAVTNNVDDLGESTIPLDATPTSMGLKVGQTIKIEKHDDVAVFEYVRVTAIDDANTEITAIRGMDETDVIAFADDAKVYNKCDYNVTLIEFASDPTDIKITLKASNGTTIHTADSVYIADSIDISPKNFIVTSAKEENSEKTTTNIIFYDQDDVNERYELKVLDNFYSENGGNRLLISNENEGDWSVGEALPKVSLTSGPNSVYIGTGNQSYSDSKWFGKINHKQFGNSFEGYFLEEARLQAIDENQTIFNVDTMLHPNYAATSNTPVVDKMTTGIIGASSGNRKLFDIKNWSATGTNATANKALLGKQTASNDLGYIPGAICSSEKITAIMSNSTVGASYTPYYASSWTHDDWGNSEEITGHLHNETFADDSNDYVKMSYCFISSKTSFDSIDVWATRYREDRNVTQEMKALPLGNFKLRFQLTTTAEMNTNLGVGKVITRKPPTGAFISDMYEKNNTLYVLYYRVNGFTHNEEWLYSIDLSQLDSLGDLTGQSINAKPITPSFPSLKNYGKDYENHGKEWWLPSDVWDGSSIPSRQKVGKDGLYSVYSNKYKWRNTDMLGFLDNGKHCKVQTVVDGITKTPDTDSNWHKNYAEDDGDHTSRIMGWVSTSGSLNYDDNSYLGSRYDRQELNHGYSFGFKEDTYRVYPVKKGLTDYRDSTDDIGVVAFLEGSQLTSNINQKHRMRRLTQGVRKWHKYNIVYNNVTPTFKTWNDYVLISANPLNHGALQRTAAKDGELKRQHSTTTTDTEGNQWVVSQTVKIGNETIDGTFSNSWNSLGLTNLNANESNASISGRILRKKNAFRIGAIYNHNVQANSGTDSEPSNTYEQAANRTITTLPPTSTSQTGQSDNDLTTGNPSLKHSVISVSKGEKFSPSTGSGRTLKTNDKLYITNIRSEESQNNTLINQWTKSTDLDTYTKIEAKPFSPVTSYSPLRVTNIGNSAFVLAKEGSNASSDTIASLYPTTGDIVNGFVKYNNSGVAQTSTNNNTFGNTNSEFLYQNPGSQLNVGMDVSFQDAVTTGTDTTVPADNVIDEYDPGNFMTGTTVYYKISLVYDGYQEGPIQNADKAVPVTGQYNFQTASLTLRLSSPPRRVSHVVIYRRNSIEEFYRMVTEVSLEDGWTYNSLDDEYSIIVTDSGTLGATYEAVTGMPESLQHTNINYKISTTALGHLVVGDCWHPEIKQGQNFIFKSQPQAYSNFNWSKDYCVLPNKPTAIAWFAGKLFAFDLHNMWRINLDNLVIEDSYEGIGCIGPESILVTDIGMFFCDYQGMYWHNGQRAENISRDILQNSASDDLKGDTLETDYPFKWAPWQRIDHQINPHILYDAKEQSVLFCFKNLRKDDGETTAYGAWKFSITRKRWDFLELENFKSVLTGNKNDIYTGAQDKLLNLGANELSRKPFKWVSKNLNMGSATEEKVLTSIKLVLNNDAQATNYLTTYKNNLSISLDNGSLQNFDNDGLTVTRKGAIIIYKPTGGKKFKKLRFEIEGQTLEIDAISIIYRNKSIK